MIIVCLGAGSGMLTEDGISRITTARVIYGSGRALDLPRG